MKKQVLGKRAKTHDARKLKKLMDPVDIGMSSYGESQRKRARIAEMKRRVLGKRARTHDTDKLKMKKPMGSAEIGISAYEKSQKKPMGAVEIGISAYEKDDPLSSPTPDYLRPESPKGVDFKDLLPSLEWDEPPVCSDNEDEIIILPDADDFFDWLLHIKL